MKRYAIHVSAYVTVEAENVAQAAKLVRENCRLIGGRSGARRSRKERDFTHYTISHAELKLGRPIRLQDNGEVPRG
jgi:hypothetical protein